MITADRQVRSTCPYCGVGCQVDLHGKNEMVFRVSAPYDAAPNYGMLCVKGRFGTDHTTPPARLKKPLIRLNTDEPRAAPPVWREASWDEALDLVAERLAGLVRQHGGGRGGTVAWAKATKEE